MGLKYRGDLTVKVEVQDNVGRVERKEGLRDTGTGTSIKDRRRNY